MVRFPRREHGRSLTGRAGPFAAIVPGLLVLLLVAPAGAYEIELPQALTDAAYVADGDCADCHEDVWASRGASFHGALEDFRVPDGTPRGCQSCHGPGSAHVESGDAADIVNPATCEPALSDRMCLQCHRTDGMHAFEASLHGMTDVTCVSCHSAHGAQRSPMLAGPEVEVCGACHQDVRTASYLPSHHPVKEGRMTCSDCHDPHGDAPAGILAGERVNDLCLGCHAGLSGPFVFEHDPVAEDCLICHDPHGAVANNLLVTNEPFLCLQCHQMHFHTTIPGVEGDVTSLDGYTVTSTRDGSKRGMLTKCTQCHSEIHGSDLPSQSISGMGGALTR